MNLEPRLSRLVAIALALAVVALAVNAVVVPVWSTYERQAEAIEQGRDQLARFLGIAAAAERADAAMTAYAGRADMGRHILSGGSPALAAAELQERVKQVVERTGGRLTSTQVLPPESELGLERVAIAVRVSVDVATLQAALHALETGTPTLVVDDVVVLARRSRGRAAGGTGADALDVRFRLIGFMGPGREAQG